MALGKAIKGITIEFDGDATPLQRTLGEIDKSLTKTQRNLNTINQALKLNPDSTILITEKLKLMDKATKEAEQKLEGLNKVLKDAESGVSALNDEEMSDLVAEIAKTEVVLEELNRESRNFELKDSIRSANAEIARVTSSLNAVNKALKLDPKNVDLLEQKMKLSARAIELNKNKLETMRKALDDADKGIIELNDEEMTDLIVEISKTEKEIEGLENSAKGAGDSIEDGGERGGISYSELAGKVRLARYAFQAVKEVVESVNEAMMKAEEFAFNLTKSVVNVATTFTREALDEYANFEQRWFAMQTLFEEESGNAIQTVANNASNAWSTMGLSAEDYFEASQNFLGAVLKTTGDVDEAAEVVEAALQAMSDDATFFGNNLEQNLTVLRAVARNNFAMIDNLQLGVAGSQKGMVELINMSGVLDHQITNLKDKSVNFTVMLQAIAAYEDQLGVSGATAALGQTTLNGTMNALQATWSNFLVSLSNSDVISPEEAVADLTSALVVFVDVWGGAIENILSNLVATLPDVVEHIRNILGSTLLSDLLSDLASTISTLIPLIISAINPLFDDLLQLIVDNKDVISEAFVSVFLVGNQIITALINSVEEHYEEIFPIVNTILNGLIDGMSKYFDVIGRFVTQLIDVFGQFIMSNAVRLWTAAFNIILTLAKSLIESLPTLLPYVSEIVLTIVEAIIEIAPSLVPAAIGLIKTLSLGLIEQIPAIIDAAVQIIIAMSDWLRYDGTMFLFQVAVELILALIEGLGSAIPNLSIAVADVLENITGGFQVLIGSAVNWGADMMANFIQGIRDKFSDLTNAVSSAASTVASYLHHTCPDVGPLANNLIENSGKDMIEGFVEGMDAATPELEAGLNTSAQIIADGMTQYQPNYGSYLEEINRSIGIGNERQGDVNVYIGNEKIDAYIAGANYRRGIVGGNY